MDNGNVIYEVTRDQFGRRITIAKPVSLTLLDYIASLTAEPRQKAQEPQTQAGQVDDMVRPQSESHTEQASKEVSEANQSK